MLFIPWVLQEITNAGIRKKEIKRCKQKYIFIAMTNRVV